MQSRTICHLFFVFDLDVLDGHSRLLLRKPLNLGLFDVSSHLYSVYIFGRISEKWYYVVSSGSTEVSLAEFMAMLVTLILISYLGQYMSGFSTVKLLFHRVIN